MTPRSADTSAFSHKSLNFAVSKRWLRAKNGEASQAPWNAHPQQAAKA
jgi:hypothetical protein